MSVIFARITKPKDPTKDSHNLGKTTLIHLIDFLLLKQIERDHIFLKHGDLFAKFTFYLEVQAPSGTFVTIKRSAKGHSKVSLRRHDAASPGTTPSVDGPWDHSDITIEKGRQLLDGYLNLSAIKNWGYRKGLTYFLRAQADYRDYFQIDKFVKGRDIDWKPYLAHVVGLDADLVEKKYLLDEQIDELEKKRAERQAEVHYTEQDYTKLQARIAIDQQDVQKMGLLLDQFDFRQEEERLNRVLVREVERRISEINKETYDVEYDLDQLRGALKTGFTFKIDTVKQIFDETNTYFPDHLRNDYVSLVEFNRKLTRERNAMIRRQIRQLETQRDELTKEAENRNQERVRFLGILGTEDTFKKFKGLQREHAKQQGELQYLIGQQERLDKVVAISKDLREKARERHEAAIALRDAVQQPSGRTKSIQIGFNGLVRQVLDLTGEFYVRMNQSDNIEFTIDTKLPGSNREVSSQAEGTSYKKLLCALFDLAILRAYANEPFYHFVYHDGILEGLDVRKRRLVLDVLRETCANWGIQCIISVIDADLPRDEADDRIPFPSQEIILDLSDSGQNGRLFRMREF